MTGSDGVKIVSAEHLGLLDKLEDLFAGWAESGYSDAAGKARAMLDMIHQSLP